MSLYLLSYDIAEGHSYDSLWKFLEMHGARRILYSQWAVPWDTNQTAFDLATAGIKHIRNDDRLLVSELFDNAATLAWKNLKISNDDFRALLKEYARTLP
jgi:hypothetical protein